MRDVTRGDHTAELSSSAVQCSHGLRIEGETGKNILILPVYTRRGKWRRAVMDRKIIILHDSLKYFQICRNLIIFPFLKKKSGENLVDNLFFRSVRNPLAQICSFEVSLLRLSNFLIFVFRELNS
jgi:hypothetical protein